MDASKLGINTAEIMETLEERYEYDESAEVIEVMTIALVRTTAPPPGREDEAEPEEGWTFLHYRCSEAGWHRQLGIIEAAKAAVIP